MHIVVTGGDGFIGRNLRVRLDELRHRDVVSVTRATEAGDFESALRTADIVFHLAGVNRPQDPAEFDVGNRELTAEVCALLRSAGRRASLVLSSSTQAIADNPYGRSKLAAEHEALRYGEDTGAAVTVLRLTNVFGKWARPHYNSAVATFCHNLARGLPITMSDPAAPLRLVHVDDVVDALIALLPGGQSAGALVDVLPVYATTVGAVARLLSDFAESRSTLVTPCVGTGFVRALYSTYVSYLPPEQFAYPLRRHADERGVFVEMLKTPDCGQFSFFTAAPGITRGGHYHHTKTEKFLVMTGQARFGFRHVVTGERREIEVTGDDSLVVETVPGWTHDITNIGAGELIVMLWANEIFDPAHPDTIMEPVAPSARSAH
jgi:UDP-2-acetamido-2,6-beta-L-arabino-hexul-4-ose reductase